MGASASGCASTYSVTHPYYIQRTCVYAHYIHRAPAYTAMYMLWALCTAAYMLCAAVYMLCAAAYAVVRSQYTSRYIMGAYHLPR